MDNTIKKMHHLWTKAIGTPNYDKEEWKDLEKDLLETKELILKLRRMVSKKSSI